MIIYAETKRQFLEDVDLNRLERRLIDGFERQTGGVPADQRVWADEYTRFSSALRRADVDDDMQVAIEYHISAAGRSRVDVLLAGNDGTNDNGLVLELKSWSEADTSDVPDLVWSPYGGGSLSQHPCVQARKYKGLILRFNADIAEKSVGIHSAAYLFNLVRRKPEPPGTRYAEWLPLYDLQAAASEFGPSVAADCLGWVPTPAGLKGDERHFVSQVFGRSMEPLIPDGSYCVFRRDVAGSRSGKVLLVQHWAISDPETGGSYTVKTYESLKLETVEAGEDPPQQHVAIQLKPRNKEFRPIWINPDQADELRVIAEFVTAIGGN